MADTDGSTALAVEVVYALPEQQVVLAVRMPEHSTAEQAIVASGLLQRCPELVLETLKVGIYGKIVKLDAPIRSGDRVEIYRPLRADPKEVRKRRAAEGKVMKKGGGSIEGGAAAASAT